MRMYTISHETTSFIGVPSVQCIKCKNGWVTECVHVFFVLFQDRLGSENADLRTILKQYLDGISVNEDVINNPGNPLVVRYSPLPLLTHFTTRHTICSFRDSSM